MMKRKIILGTLLLLCLTITAAIVAVVPAFAGSKQNDLTSRSNMGRVIIQLPPPGGAIASHPTYLDISAADWTRGTTFFGSAGHDLLTVSIWNSTLNLYLPVAYITDNADPELADFIKTAWAGIPWTENIIVVGENELQVRTDYGYGDKSVLMANLTRAVDIKFGNNFPNYKSSNFTLPAMSMVFRGIGDDYKVEAGERVTTLPKPPYSGYTYTQYGWERPAFVEYTIKAWGISANYAVGVMRHDWAFFYLPPA